MPSPFPGMDPYLEDPGLWPDVHHEILSAAREILNHQLRPKYLVRIEERVYISGENDPGRPVIPDVHISARSGWEGKPYWPRAGGRAEVAEPVEGNTMIEEEVHEAYLSIIDRAGQSVVTVIELLSPTNKVPGSQGRVSSEQKREEVLHSPSHWVEVDLLRGGVGFRPWWLRSPCEYFVHVSRAEKRPKGLVWPIRLSQHLPVITIPLRPEDPDASLDLQAVIATAYDRAGYDLSVDYGCDPVPPLTGEWPGWADALLKARGLRPA
jgi:Protein of unknown function (DUF4058)